jgi:hypothetical protein
MIGRVLKVGGDGGFDYVYADSAGRRLYIPRTGTNPRVTVFNLDTLEPVGEISKASAHGAAVDPKSGHGFCSSKPVVMWDTKTNQILLITAEYGPPPTPPPAGGRGGRAPMLPDTFQILVVGK